MASAALFVPRCLAAPGLQITLKTLGCQFLSTRASHLHGRVVGTTQVDSLHDWSGSHMHGLQTNRTSTNAPLSRITQNALSILSWNYRPSCLRSIVSQPKERSLIQPVFSPYRQTITTGPHLINEQKAAPRPNQQGPAPSNVKR